MATSPSTFAPRLRASTIDTRTWQWIVALALCVGAPDAAYAQTPLGREFPMGLLIVQNGEAPEPDDTSDINGYEFDGSTQFMYLNFADALEAFFP